MTNLKDVIRMMVLEAIESNDVVARITNNLPNPPATDGKLHFSGFFQIKKPFRIKPKNLQIWEFDKGDIVCVEDFSKSKDEVNTQIRIMSRSDLKSTIDSGNSDVFGSPYGTRFHHVVEELGNQLRTNAKRVKRQNIINLINSNYSDGQV